MASTLTGCGMSAAIKIQCSQVRAAVDARPRRDRLRWMQPVYASVIDGNGDRMIKLTGYEPASINPRDRHMLATRRA